jgi:predicted Zn-dependent protease
MSDQTRKSAAKITRAKAEAALSRGADPTLEMFAKHPNKHVRIKAEKLAARAAGTPAIAAE